MALAIWNVPTYVIQYGKMNEHTFIHSLVSIIERNGCLCTVVQCQQNVCTRHLLFNNTSELRARAPLFFQTRDDENEDWNRPRLPLIHVTDFMS
jgi:hypothetical protein